jgi:hypothetical protein
VSRKSPYLTLAAAAVFFAVMVVIEAAAASDDSDHSEYGGFTPSTHAARTGPPVVKSARAIEVRVRVASVTTASNTGVVS